MHFSSPIVTNQIHGLVLVAWLINTWSVILKSTHGLVLVAWLISNIFLILTEFSAGLFLRCCFDAEFWNSMDAELLSRHCGKKLEAEPICLKLGVAALSWSRRIPPAPELLHLEKRQRKPPLVLTGFILKLATGNRKGGPGSELTSRPLGRLTWVTSQSGGKIWIQGLRVPGHSMDSGQYFVSQRTP